MFIITSARHGWLNVLEYICVHLISSSGQNTLCCAISMWFIWKYDDVMVISRILTQLYA